MPFHYYFDLEMVARVRTCAQQTQLALICLSILQQDQDGPPRVYGETIHANR